MQEKHSCRDAFIPNLSLQKEFPEMKGFSETNIKYMRQWYLFFRKGLQVVGETEEKVANLVIQIP